MSRNYVPQLGLQEKCKDVHAIYVPEMSIDLDAEAARLSRVMDEVGNVNIFISEVRPAPPAAPAQAEQPHASPSHISSINPMTTNPRPPTHFSILISGAECDSLSTYFV